MFPDAESPLFTASTLVLMAMSLFFTMLLVRSKPSNMNKSLQKRAIETPQETKTVKTTKASKIPKSPKVAPPLKGCNYYFGYLEKISASSFPYECLACPKIRECVGEKEIKPQEVDSDIDMSEYRIATRIKATIEKANSAPWKDLRGKNEQAISRDHVPELYELLKELGGRVKHDDWEYQCYETPLNIVVRTKHNAHK